MRTFAALALIAGLCAACVASSKGSAAIGPMPSTVRTAPPPTAFALVSKSIAAGNLGAARAIVEKARREGDSEADLSLASAEIALAEERLGVAEEHLAVAASEAPDLATVDLLRGRMEEMRGRWNEARTAYALAGRKDPSSSSPLVLEARVALVLGKPAEASDLLARAVQAAPGSAELQRAAGEAYLAAGDSRKAVVYLRQARALDPSDHGSFESLALALHRLGRHADVVALLDGRKSESLPDHIRLLIGRSALLAGRGDIAASMLESCARTWDEDPEVWLDLARASVLSGRDADARAAAERALALQPDSIKALLLLGHIHKLAGRSRDAGTCYARALREGADPVIVAPLIEALVPASSDRRADALDEDCSVENAPKAPGTRGRTP